MSSVSCPLCNTKGARPVDAAFFDCGHCRGLFRKREQLPDPETEKARYLEHNNDIVDPGYRAFTAPVTDYILEQFSPAHTGLDFGAGPGPVITAALREKGYRVHCYDPFFHPDTAALSRRYDYIFACEVIEHFHNPRREFAGLAAMLQPAGELICMTHIYRDETDFANWYYRRDPTHCFIYREATVRYLSENFGLRLTKFDDRLFVLQKIAR